MYLSTKLQRIGRLYQYPVLLLTVHLLFRSEKFGNHHNFTPVAWECRRKHRQRPPLTLKEYPPVHKSVFSSTHTHTHTQYCVHLLLHYTGLWNTVSAPHFLLFSILQWLTWARAHSRSSNTQWRVFPFQVHTINVLVFNWLDSWVSFLSGRPINMHHNRL